MAALEHQSTVAASTQATQEEEYDSGSELSDDEDDLDIRVSSRGGRGDSNASSTSVASTVLPPPAAPNSPAGEEVGAPAAASAPAQETRAQKLDRLAREYEEEVARMKAAAAAGEEVCLYCSA